MTNSRHDPAPEVALTRDLVIVNANGLHARPASLFVATARRFRADITVTCEDRRADGRSVMALLTLAAAEGCRITVSARGDDAADALSAICALVTEGFDDTALGDPACP